MVAGCKSAGQVWEEKEPREVEDKEGTPQRRVGGMKQEEEEDDEEGEGGEKVSIRSLNASEFFSRFARERARFRRHAWADQQITPVLYF